MNSIMGVQISEVDQIWGYAAPQIEKVINRFADEYTLDSVLEKLKTSEMQLWVGFTDKQPDGIAVTRVVPFPNSKFLEIVMVSGSLDTLEHIEEIEIWAEDIGCDRVVCYCRPGVSRFLKTRGYHRASEVMEKRIAQG